ncbi:hypothetical protein [Phytoactinopolyspora mesophila]|nr:hypothetical protein [Phytoactinopolyspora mesophila]
MAEATGAPVASVDQVPFLDSPAERMSSCLNLDPVAETRRVAAQL